MGRRAVRHPGRPAAHRRDTVLSARTAPRRRSRRWGHADLAHPPPVGHRPAGLTPRTHGPGAGDGYGLVGMRERVEALGGTVHAGPGTDTGWTVRAVPPSAPGPGVGRAGRAGGPVTIRVLLADDQPLVRNGLRVVLEDQPDLEVVAEAADGTQAVALARTLRPDVCLVDIRMPEPDGIEVARALAGPDVADPLRVVVVTTFDTDEHVYGALRAGAVGFVLKDAGPALLVEAVRAAHAGDALVSPSVTVRLLRHLTGPDARPARHDAGAVPPLSARETDVVRAIAVGRTNLEIGAELFLSLSTVKGYVATVQGKLGLRNRVEIAAWAWENGVARPDGHAGSVT